MVQPDTVRHYEDRKEVARSGKSMETFGSSINVKISMLEEE
jgi:hypothetical protein